MAWRAAEIHAPTYGCAHVEATFTSLQRGPGSHAPGAFGRAQKRLSVLTIARQLVPPHTPFTKANRDDLQPGSRALGQGGGGIAPKPGLRHKQRKEVVVNSENRPVYDPFTTRLRWVSPGDLNRSFRQPGWMIRPISGHLVMG